MMEQQIKGMATKEGRYMLMRQKTSSCDCKKALLTTKYNSYENGKSGAQSQSHHVGTSESL